MTKEIQKFRLILILFVVIAWLTEGNRITIDAKALIPKSEISFINPSLYYERKLSYENLIVKDKDIQSISNDFNQIIEIPDIQLKKEINRELGKLETEDITLGELQSLSWLDLSNKNISSIEGLQYATNLTTLYLSNNQISDISALGEGNFTNLTTLYLSNNQISDISALGEGKFTNLTTLHLTNNQISDISALGEGNFTNLTTLYLSNNQISDISALGEGNFTNLTTLYLSNNQISDISALGEGNFTNLTKLYLYQNQISDISALGEGNFTNLTTLALYHNQISDISALGEGNFTNLTTLALFNNQISDISPLGEGSYANLTTLYLYQNQISDISALGEGNFTNLTTLYLDQNQISDISPLGEGSFENLEYLYLSYNQISDLSSLGEGNFANLTTLTLSYQEILLETMELCNGETLEIINPIKGINGKNIEPSVSSGFYHSSENKLIWEGINQSQDVKFSFNEDMYLGEVSFRFSGTVTLPVNVVEQKIIDIPDAELKKQINIELGKSYMEDITQEELQSLRILNLQDKNISSIEGLQYATNLTTLYLSNNQISDISALGEGNFTNLTSLDLSYNQITNVSILSNLSSIKSLKLNNNKISEIGTFSNLKLLEAFDISNQQIVFPTKIIEKGNDVILNNPLKVPDVQIKNIISVANGSFDEDTNIVKFSDVEESSLLNYTFFMNIKIGKKTYKFNGIVIQPIEIIGEPFLDKSIVNIPDNNLRQAIYNELDISLDKSITKTDLAELTSLSASSENIINLEGLQYAVHLNKLTLGSNQISDLTPLNDLVSLEYLYLSNNKIKNLTPLSNLKFLKELYLNSNQIEDVGPLSELKYLSTIYLNSNLIKDASPLKKLTMGYVGYDYNLKDLWLQNNQITDFTGIKATWYVWGQNQKVQLDQIIVQGSETTVDLPIVYNVNGYEMPLKIESCPVNCSVKNNQLTLAELVGEGEVILSFYFNSGLGYGYTNGDGKITIPFKVNEEPIITVPSIINITVGSPFDPYEWMSASDKEDGDLTSDVIIKGEVDVNTVGNYPLTFEVSDSRGILTKVSVIVKVKTNEKPVISGVDDVTIKVGDLFDPRQGVTVIDKEDGDLTDQLIISGQVNTSQLGEYTLTYSITDSDQNTTTTIRKVTVVYSYQDLNQDGVVDNKDLEIIKDYYNITSEDESWNSEYDFNQDGIIDLYDMVLISTQIN